ncbi:MAG: RES family NAD+ phosphorylase [Paucimonas sp.]|jgi:hypothetical protein|nr:RES family NAD+ phosphorylase [Paucimonas sp.]
MTKSLQAEIRAAISSHGLPLVDIAPGTLVWRVQETRFSDPLFYNPQSDSRYGDPQRLIGVCYVAGSDLVAVAETLQHGKAGAGEPVLAKEIEARSLHQLEAARALRVVDAGVLARNAGKRLRDIVGSKGQGSTGYAYTQVLSGVVMRHGLEVDGLLYPSQVYPISASFRGCNLALFAGRAVQLEAVGKQVFGELELSSGETVGEFLNRLRIPVE